MNGISDAVVIGVVLGLIFAAVSYYIYSRTTQIERKVGLIENILLDLKVTTEQALLNATEGGGMTHHEIHEEHHALQSREQQRDQQREQQNGQNEQQQESGVAAAEGVEGVAETRDVVVDQASRGRTQPAQPIVVEREQPRDVERDGQSVSTNYELLTYKELTALAKKLGISGLRNQSKAFVIDAIRAHEQGSGATGSSGSVGGGGGSGGSDESPNHSGQSNLTQWATGTVNFQDGAVNPLNDVAGDGPGAMNAAQGDADGAPLGAGDVETSLVA